MMNGRLNFHPRSLEDASKSAYSTNDRNSTFTPTTNEGDQVVWLRIVEEVRRKEEKKERKRKRQCGPDYAPCVRPFEADRWNAVAEPRGRTHIFSSRRS